MLKNILAIHALSIYQSKSNTIAVYLSTVARFLQQQLTGMRGDCFSEFLIEDNCLKSENNSVVALFYYL